VLLQVGLGSAAVAALVLIVGATTPDPNRGPGAGDYVGINEVPLALADPPGGPDASMGRFAVSCGRNERGHRNSDNVIVAPGTVNAAHHIHDYVGNLSADAFSTDASLATADTTCTNGDRSTYYWPVLRRLNAAGGDAHVHGGGLDGNHGSIVAPSEVRIEFHGNPAGPVVDMPRFLRVATGDARALTNGPQPFARVQWTCSNEPRRRTDRYPRCPAGARTVRIFDFPSCWNGQTTDSDTHRTHVVFPEPDGACLSGFRAVPALRIEVAYDLSENEPFAIDTFPEQRRSPRTDHADFINVMTDDQMAQIVDCLNTGRTCPQP